MHHIFKYDSYALDIEETDSGCTVHGTVWYEGEKSQFSYSIKTHKMSQYQRGHMETILMPKAEEHIEGTFEEQLAHKLVYLRHWNNWGCDHNWLVDWLFDKLEEHDQYSEKEKLLLYSVVSILTGCNNIKTAPISLDWDPTKDKQLIEFVFHKSSKHDSFAAQFEI